jgi:hypothetical protein
MSENAFLRRKVARPSPSHVQAKIPHAVLTQSQSQARPEGTECRTRPCNRRNEATIPAGVVRESLNRSPWPSTLQSTKTWLEGFSPITTGRDRAPGGPSWLTFLGHMKETLWSMDLFRCESETLRTHWVLLVMDQYTATDHWFRRPCRHGRCFRTLSHVQPRHSRSTLVVKVPQLRP